MINKCSECAMLLTIYNNNALMKTPDRSNWVQSTEPKFQPVRPGKVVDSFFRNFSGWTEPFH